MDSSSESEINQLEQNLLKCYDKEAVSKLLDKKVEGQARSVQWEGGESGPAKRAKKFEGTQEEKSYLMSKIEMLEAELRTEKSYRTHYEAKASKEIRNVKKLEDSLRNLKSLQYSSSKFEQLKSKLLVRIGDIEKDTIETKAVVVAELKNISDIKKPLENVNKLVEFLKSEVDARDENIEKNKEVLVEKDKIILNLETRLASGISSTLPTEMKEIADIIKCSEELNSELANIKKCSDEKDEILRKLKIEVDEKASTLGRLRDDLEHLSSKNRKLLSKKEKLAEDYDDLESCLAKAVKKLDKKKEKLEKVTMESESAQYEIGTLKELNGNILEQMSALKQESVLLRERISLKDAKLLRTEGKLNLSKEALKMEVLQSFKLSEEHLQNQITRKDKDVVRLRCEIESSNLKVNNLLKENHKLQIEGDKLKLETNLLVRNQKAELKKLRRLQESSNSSLSNTIKLLKSRVTELEELSKQEIDRAGEAGKMSDANKLPRADLVDLRTLLHNVGKEVNLQEEIDETSAEVNKNSFTRVGNAGQSESNVMAGKSSALHIQGYLEQGAETELTSCGDEESVLHKFKDVSRSETEHLKLTESELVNRELSEDIKENPIGGRSFESVRPLLEEESLKA
eukprot:GFUD01026751.1.p1 GENE.GFUD01026751.1~~GFUD01026751.1.p1  ORF type:complete len:628 (-),score=197.71 GFUD01026751.1:36-1919(-)